MPNIGGLNVAIGLDTSALTRGIEDAKQKLNGFKKKLVDISLESAIKGDPLKSLNDHLRTTKKELDSVFNSFSKYIKSTNVDMGAVADKVTKNTRRVVKAWDKMVSHMQKDPRLKAINELSPDYIEWGRKQKRGTKAPVSEFLADSYMNQLKKLNKEIQRMPNYSQKIKDKIANSAIFKNAVTNITGVKKAIKELRSTIQRSVEGEITSKYKELMNLLAKSYRIQRGAELLKQTSQAKDLNLAYENRRKILQKLLIAQQKYHTLISAGINVEENRKNLLASMDTQRKLGIELTNKQTAAYMREYAASLKLTKFTGFDKQKYSVELKNAGSIIEATKRRGIAVRRLKLEEAKLNAEIEIGMNVSANKLALLKNLENRERMLGGLDNKRRQQMHALRIEVEKLNAAQRKAYAKTGIFSAEWLKYRLGWFIQLRVAWRIYRGMQSTIRSLMEAETQLARAMRTANSEILTRVQISKEYTRVMSEVAATMGATWQQSGEVLYQLTSAGLSSEEAIAGLKPALNLIIGLEGDATTTTKALVSVYKNFGDSITEVENKQDKLQYISDLITKTWKRNQIELSELTSAYNYVAASANAAGLSLRQVTAILAVLHNHAIKGSRAGRMLNNMLSKISRNRNLFKEMFDVDIDLNKPLDLINILTQLNKKLSTGKLSVAELESLFKIFGLRSTTAAITLTKAIGEYNVEMENTKNVTNESMRVVEERLHNLSSQFALFWKNSIAAINIATKNMRDKMTEALIKINEQLSTRTESRSAEKVVETLMGLKKQDLDAEIGRLGVRGLQELRGKIMKQLFALRKELPPEFAAASEEVTKIYNKYINFLNNLIRKGKSLQFVLYGPKTRKEVPKVKEPLAKTEAQYELDILNARVHPLQQIEKLQKKIAFYKRMEAKAEEDVKAATTQAALRGATETLLRITKKRVAAEKQIKSLQKSISSERIKNLTSQQRELAAKVKTLQLQDKELKLQGLTAKEYEKRLVNIDQEKKYAYEIADNAKKMAILRGVNKDLAEKETENMKIEADQAARTAKEQAKILRYNTERREISKEYQKRIAIEEEILAKLQLQHATEAEITAQKKKINDLSLEKARIDEDLAIKNQQTRLSIEKAIIQAKVRGIKLQEELTRETHPFYAVWADMRDKLQDVNTMLRNLGGQAINNFASSFADLVVNVTEGSARMGESLRKFFLNLIEDINRTIIRWLVLNAISGIMGSMGPTTVSAHGVSSTSIPLPNASTSLSFGAFKASGGILPQIEAFRQFSSGGLTSRPTLAVLGDNASKKEIVIPEENIKSNQVSGYVRNQGEEGITIINAITRDDIAQAMTSNTGKNVIINTIGKDLNKRGPTYKRFHTS